MERMMTKKSHQTPVLRVVLPDKINYNITVGFRCRGQEVISQLSQLLGIKDLHLFGLSLIKGHDQLFLDLEKKLRTYFPKAWKRNTSLEKIILYLRVRYYIRDGRLIAEEKARSLYCADLRGRVLNSQCYGQEGQYFQLAAYALQAELGDWRESQEAYFNPHEYFPPWPAFTLFFNGQYPYTTTTEQILERRGCDYVLQHTPGLHRELKGMSASDASLLFIEEACNLSDVPLTFYTMSKGKKEQRGNVSLGLALTGLHVCEIVNGEQQLLYEFAWSSIDRLTFQGRRFEIRVNAVSDSTLVLYTCSALHSKHLLNHISTNHRVHLNSKHSAKSQTAEGKRLREMYIRDINDPDTEDSEDELPPMKIFLHKARQHHSISSLKMWESDFRIPRKGQSKTGFTSADSDEIELCVDEPAEMFVDDPEEIINVTELLEGVSVDGPLTMGVTPWVDDRSPWIDVTVEMKHVLKMRTNRLSVDSSRDCVEKHPLVKSSKRNQEEDEEDRI